MKTIIATLAALRANAVQGDAPGTGSGISGLAVFTCRFGGMRFTGQRFAPEQLQ